MKKKIIFLGFLLVAAISFLSFSYSKTKHKKSATVKTCNCNKVTGLSGVHHGTNSTVSWGAPSGDAVSSYSYAGYNSCGGAPFSGTTTNLSVEVPNPNQCSGTTVTVITNCANGCRSSGVTTFF